MDNKRVKKTPSEKHCFSYAVWPSLKTGFGKSLGEDFQATQLYFYRVYRNQGFFDLSL